MPEETVKPVSFDQAFAAAKTELDKPEPVAEKTVEAPKGDDTKPAEAKETKPEQTDKPADQASETGEENELLSIEERAKLNAEGKKAYEKLMKSYTPKTQAIAAERKKIAEERETLAKHKELIEAFESDPKETLRRLAKVYDVPLQDTKPESVKAVESQVSEMSADLLNVLGADNTELAQALSGVFEKHMKRVAETVTKTEVEPMRKTLDETSQRAIAEAAESDMKVFESKHKDWKQFEPQIVELGKKFQPAPGAKMSPVEYLDILYQLATADRSKASLTADVINRLNESAKSVESPATGVTDQNVTPVAPEHPTIEQAYEAAKKGIRWAAR